MIGFRKSLETTISGNHLALRIDRITELYPEGDILDSPDFSIKEKKSAMQYMIYKFHFRYVLTYQEDRYLRVFLKKKSTPAENKRAIRAIKEVRKRYLTANKDKENAGEGTT